MFAGLKWVRLIPDQPGKGGWKSGFHSFQAQPVNDTRSVSGMHVWRGRWRKDPDTTAIAGTGADVFSQPLSLHAYLYPSLTDPSAQPGMTILGHHIDFANPASNRYWDFTAGGARNAHLGNSVPATFLDINGRCFVADGAREGMVLDDRPPAIHLQKNQNLGIGTPQQQLGAVTLVTVPNLTPYGLGYIFNNHAGAQTLLMSPNPNSPIGEIDVTDTVTLTKIDPSYTAITGTPPGVFSPVASGYSSNTAPTSIPFNVGADLISCVNGSSVVTRSGAWPAGPGQVAGLSINFAGRSYLLGATDKDAAGDRFGIDGTLPGLGANQAVIYGVYDGPTVTNVPFTITGCRVLLPDVNSLAQANAGTLGYSQSTQSSLVPVLVSAVRASSLSRNLGNISVGPKGGGSPSTLTTANMATGNTTVQFSSGGTPIVSTDVGKTMIVDRADAGGTMLVATIVSATPFFGPLPGCILSLPNGSGAPVVNQRAWWSNDFVGATDIAMAGGSAVATSASNPWSVNDVGKFIMVAGAGAPGAPGPALFTTILTFTNKGQVTLGAVNASGGALAGKQAQWGGGASNTTVGPTYAYAWYDPETGAMSNICPLYQIPRPTIPGAYPDFANLTPVFRIDNGVISYPSGVDATRFSHVVFFRTLSTPGTSTLYPIGSLTPFVGKVHPGLASTRGSWNPLSLQGWVGLPNIYTDAPPAAASPNYWFDFSSDSDLLLSGGFRAPQETNEKPMVTLRGGIEQPGLVSHQAFWDQRLWVVNTQEPDKIAFSCDNGQCPLGVPEESFPPTNFLRIPSVDGRVLGMRTVGELLLVTTERWAYTVAGNNESNYRLLRISTRMAGVGTYQMDEFSSDIEGTSSTVYYFGKDGIMYEWVPGGNAKNISDPIQDVASKYAATLVSYQRSRVYCVSINSRRLVILSGFVSVSNNPENPMIFDTEKRVWTNNQTGDTINFGATAYPAAFATIYGLNPPIQSIFSVPRVGGGVPVRSWLLDNPSSTLPGTIVTFPMNFDGLKTRKQLVMVNAHLSGGTATCSVSVNETTPPATVSMVAYPDPLYSVYGAGAVPVDSATAEDLVTLTAMFNPATGAAPVGYRFSITVNATSTNQQQEIYAVDVGFKEYEEQGDSDA